MLDTSRSIRWDSLMVLVLHGALSMDQGSMIAV
jgi:hypothetical protein